MKLNKQSKLYFCYIHDLSSYNILQNGKSYDEGTFSSSFYNSIVGGGGI
jgi:hypothetical protein